MEKVTLDLASQIDATEEDGLVEVVVELEAPRVRSAVPSGDRATMMAQRKDTFRAIADPVIRLIVDEGGEVLGEAWLNQTVRARVPARSVAHLSAASGVTAVDVPKRIEPEVS